MREKRLEQEKKDKIFYTGSLSISEEANLIIYSTMHQTLRFFVNISLREPYS